MATRIGSAFVAIEADTRLFRSELIAGVTKAVAGVDAKIPVTADTKTAIAQVAALKRRMEALNKYLAEVKIGANGKPAEATIRRLQLQLKDIADTVANITVHADTSRLNTAIAKEEANLAKLRAQASSLVLDANEAKLATKIAAAEASLSKLNAEASDIVIDADNKKVLSRIADAELQAHRLRAALGDPDAIHGELETAQMEAKIDSLDAEVLVLIEHLHNIEINGEDTLLLRKIYEVEAELKVLRSLGDVPLIANAVQLDAKIAESEARARALKAELADLKIGGKSDLATLAKAEGLLTGVEEGAHKLNPELKDLNNSLVQGGRGFGRFGLGVLTARVALFGGFTAISGFHIALDVIVESLAVLIPALVTAAAGLVAFGLAGSDAAKAVAFRLQNVHTVADAFNTTIPPMTNNLEKLHAVVRPQVWQLYGDAIDAAGTHSNRFNNLAIATGGVVDRLAAKLTVLVQTSGPGIDKFFASGARDLQQFARILSNLGDAIGKLIQISERTGIAEALLSILNAAAKLFDLFTKLPIPLLEAIVVFHGIYLWSGLAASGLTRMLRPLTAMLATVAGTKAAGTAVAELAAAGSSTRFKRFGATVGDLGTNLKAAGGRAVTAVKALGGFIFTPWGAAIAVGVIALGALAFALSRVRDSTGEAITAIDKMVNTATVYTVINKLGEGLAQSSKDIAAAQRKEAIAASAAGAAIQGAGQKYTGAGSSILGATTETQRFRAEHAKLISQLDTVTGHLAQVAKAYGTQGLAGAEALAVAAGVKVSDLLSNDPKKWAVALQMIDGLVKGYNNMGVGATQLGNALNVLTISQSDQLKAMQNLNTAYDAFTKIVSGPIDGFLQFANTLKRFQSDATKANAHITGLGVGFTGVSKKVTDASLQLQSDFQDTFSSATQMADAFRLTGTSADKQIGAIKDWVQILIPMAGQNKAAAAEISALAQEAGGPATLNLKELAKWAGHTKDPLNAAQKAAQDAAISFFNMSEDAKKLGTTLSQDLTADTAKAVEGAVGLSGAMDKFAKDLTHSGVSISQTNADRKKLIADLAAVGVKGAAANAIINSISGQLQGVKGPVTNAAAQFEDFANNALKLSTTKADQLWKSLHDQNLTILGGKANITKDQFISLAENGWNLNTTQAKKLWNMLQQQYLDRVGGKADITKGKFEKLAHDGLDLSKNAADALWKKLQLQRLDEVGRKADTTRVKFEQLAAKIGLNTSKADLLFDALHHLPGKTNLSLTVDAKGFVKVNGVAISAGAYFSPHAAGGFISGGVPGKDSVPGMLMPGEVVVPTTMVKQGAVDHLRGRLPGFAAGGQVGSPQAYATGGKVNIGDTGNLTLDFPKNVVTSINDFTGRSTAQIAVSATTAFAKAAAAALAKFNAGTHVPNVGSGVARWAPLVKQALAMERLPAADILLVLYQMLTESGGNPNAINLTDSNAARGTPSKGLMQVIGPTFARYHWPGTSGNIYDPLANIAAALNYAVHNKGIGTGPGQLGSGHGYAAGGLVGSIVAAQAAEQSQFTGLEKAFKTGPKKYLTKLTVQELGTLAARQSAETAAFRAVASGTATRAELSHLGATARAEKIVASDQALNRLPGGHPGIAANLRTDLSRLNTLSAQPAPKGTSGGGGGGGSNLPTGAQLKFWLGAAQYGELLKYKGLTSSFAHGPAKYLTTTVKGELKTLAARQASEAAAYKAAISGTMTKAEVSHLGATARSEYSTAADQGLNKLPGGHPGFAKDLRTYLAQLSRLSGTLIPGSGVTGGGGGTGGKPPVVPPLGGTLPPLPPVAHTYGGDVTNSIGAFLQSVIAPFINGGMVTSYDSGGWLKPGLTMAYNGTGRNEQVGGGQNVNVSLTVDTAGGSAADQYLAQMIRRFVKIKGGGNVQRAFGQAGTVSGSSTWKTG